jgi:hypothetical protein
MESSRSGKVLPPHQEAGDDSRGCRCAGLARVPGKRIPDADQQAPAESNGRAAARRTLPVFSAPPPLRLLFPIHYPPATSFPLSSIFRILFQVPNPVSPLLVTLTKTAGVCTNNSHSGSSRGKPAYLVTRHSTQLLSSQILAHSFALFCTDAKHNPFLLSHSALFAQKHRVLRQGRQNAKGQ